MAPGDFAQKLGMVLKAINLSRGRLAQTVGVDKSVVSRWASGVQAPTDHNLSLLTEAVARHRAGFERRDWDRDAASFANRLDALVADRSSFERPSIAVLPFENMSGDPEQEYFADGMVDDIITALSRNKQLFVIARNSSFTYKGKSPDVRQVGRELGVRYVLEGSVRKSGNRVRITGQLIDASTGGHIWADRFEGYLDDIFELQDQVASSVIGGISTPLINEEMERAKRKVGNLHAYDYFLRGWAAARRRTAESSTECLTLLGRAVAFDPDFALGHAAIATFYNMRRSFGWMDDSVRETEEAERAVRRALDLDRTDSRSPFMVRTDLGHDVGPSA